MSTLSSYTLQTNLLPYHHIYGFGKYEDVPAGFNVSGIIGWTDKNNYHGLMPVLTCKEIISAKSKIISTSISMPEGISGKGGLKILHTFYLNHSAV